MPFRLTRPHPARPVRQRHERSSVAFAAAFVVAVCLSILAIESWQIYSARRYQIAESEAAATNLAKALAEHASGTFLQADGLLMGLVERVETDGFGASNVERIHRLLRAEILQLPQLQRLSLIDATGHWITTDANDAMQAHVGHADREYFRHHASHVDSAAHLGPPIKSRSTGEWIVTVSRRLNHPDGSFAGIALASIKLSFFDAHFRQFEIGERGAIVLAMSDGTVIDRRPFKADLIGQSLIKAPLFRDHIAFDDAGIARITSVVDGVERLTAFQKLNIFPAYAIVAFSEDQILRGWIGDAIVQASTALLLVTILAIVGWRLVRQVAQRHADQVALLASQSELNALNAKLDALARIDGLTGLANRREFDLVLENEIKRLDRSGGPLALIMIDIDRFKAYNDRFGHPQGDECIRVVAGLVQQCVSRPSDLAARYGGEEFVLLLPSTNADGAMAVAQKLQRTMHEVALPHPAGRDGIVTASMGISVLDSRDKNPSGIVLLTQADRALYAAKEAGRDEIRLFRHPREMRIDASESMAV